MMADEYKRLAAVAIMIAFILIPFACLRSESDVGWPEGTPPFNATMHYSPEPLNEHGHVPWVTIEGHRVHLIHYGGAGYARVMGSVHLDDACPKCAVGN